MPPRKSDASKTAVVATADESPSTAAVAGGVGIGASAKKDLDGVNIEDLNLPKSIVTRLAKGVLPPNTQIQGDAMLALSKSATVFVNYLATHANEYTQAANRKNILPADVFKALDEIEFDYKDRLEAELAKFNEVQTEKRNIYRKKVADKASSAVGAEGGKTVSAGGTGANGLSHAKVGSAAKDGQPAAKRARMDVDAEAAEEEGSDMVDEANEDGEEVEDDVEDIDEEEEEGDDVEGEGDDPADDAVEEDAEMEDDNDREAVISRDEALDNGEDSD